MSGNHNSGRRRKPVKEHRLLGTFQHSRHGGQGETPEPPAGPVVKPERLSIGASGVWDVLAPLAIGMGSLTPADVWAFACLCELQATLEWACGLKTHDPQRFAPKLERDTAAALRPFYSLFGFTPEGRARLHIKPAADPSVNPLDKFLTRKPSKWAGALP